MYSYLPRGNIPALKPHNLLPHPAGTLGAGGPTVPAPAPRRPPPLPSWRAGRAQGRRSVQTASRFPRSRGSPRHDPVPGAGRALRSCPSRPLLGKGQRPGTCPASLRLGLQGLSSPALGRGTCSPKPARGSPRGATPHPRPTVSCPRPPPHAAQGLGQTRGLSQGQGGEEAVQRAPGVRRLSARHGERGGSTLSPALLWTCHPVCPSVPGCPWVRGGT